MDKKKSRKKRVVIENAIAMYLLDMYALPEPTPSYLTKERIEKITVHHDFSSNNKAGVVTLNAPTTIPVPIDKPIRIVCVGLKSWTIEGNVSFGMHLPQVVSDHNTLMNGKLFHTTLQANGHSMMPEAVFVQKPEPFVRTLIEDLKEDALKLNVVSVICTTPGEPEKVFLATEKLNDKVICPMGFLMKREPEAKSYPIERNTYEGIVVPKVDYESKLEDYKKQLQENKVVWTAGTKIQLYPSNTDAGFYGSVILEIFYSKA
jgi:hypothetical protein